MGILIAPRVSLAQAVPLAEREALERLLAERGGQAEGLDALIRRVDRAGAEGLPIAPLTNKIREGLAKGHDPKRIDSVIRQMALHLETADHLMRELGPAAADAGRDRWLTLLAESLESGVTSEEVRELQQFASRTPDAREPVSPDRLSSAAKGLAFVKEAGLPVGDGTAVMVEAVRRGYRSYEILDLGRGIKLREADYRSGRSSLQALRDAIARGDRPDQLFRDARPQSVSRPAAERPETAGERPARPARPETLRPAQPERPARPERPGGSVR
jgi:hypothetical protein